MKKQRICKKCGYDYIINCGNCLMIKYYNIDKELYFRKGKKVFEDCCQRCGSTVFREPRYYLKDLCYDCHLLNFPKKDKIPGLIKFD